tara:strand:- start:3865 stop:4794 length:930 start_codon:yes stop_codon:yes gene_type:complete
MSYQLVRLSALSGKETGYSLLGTDLVYSTLGTGVDSLSSIKVTLTELGQYISDTRVFWNSGGATDKVYPKSLSSKLGIGTDSPVVSLDVTGTDAIVIPVGSTGQRPTAETGMIRYNSTNTQFEGYGASSWQGLGGVIDVDQDTKIQAEESADEDKLRFDTAGSQRMVIDATGKVGISMEPAASSSQLTVVGSISAQGAIYATDDITAYSSSDERLKKGLAVISNPLYKISQLNGYSFEWNETAQQLYPGKQTGTEYGVVAQEVEQVLPEAVETRSTGYKAVNYNQLVPLLIECIKDLSARVKQLEGDNG